MSNTGRTGTSEESLKILVVDDEPAMVGALGALLGQAGHRIVAAYDGEEALRRFHEDEPDLVLLDLAMPGPRWRDRLQAHPRDQRCAHRGGVRRARPGRDRGAAGPGCRRLHPQALPCRRAAGACARRGPPDVADAPHPRHRCRRPRRSQTGWELDRRRHEIRWRGTVVPATVTEFRLLRELVGRLGEVVSHDDLLKAGWPDVPDPDPLWLKPHLARLREKLVNAGAPIPVAVRGVGYLLEDHPGA